MTDIYCYEIGCGLPAYAVGRMFSVGQPPGDVTFMRRIRCFDGHSYLLDCFDHPEVAWLWPAST